MCMFLCCVDVISHNFVIFRCACVNCGLKWLCKVKFVEVGCAIGGLYHWWSGFVESVVVLVLFYKEF